MNKKKTITKQKSSTLNNTLFQEMKSWLEQEKIRLEEELLKFTKRNPNIPDDFDTTYPEYGDKSDENAQEITEYLANKPLEIQLENLLRDVNKALDSIAKGTYGTCKYCDELIDENRLRARPMSSACISCKKTLTQEL